MMKSIHNTMGRVPATVESPLTSPILQRGGGILPGKCSERDRTIKHARLFILLFGCAVVFEAAGATVSFNFDDYTDGYVNNQHGWTIVRGSPAGFLIENTAGYDGAAVNKALKIEYETQHSTVLAPEELQWLPSDTWSLNLDFKLGLSAVNNSHTNLIFGLLMGDSKLSDRARWIEALGIQPNGKWSWIGGAPNWKIDRDLTKSLFMDRPDSGCTESPWFHLKFTSKKLEKRNSFQSRLVVSRYSDGKVMLSRDYQTKPEYSKMATDLWRQNAMRFGFCQGRSSPSGCVWIDNIKVVSISFEIPEPSVGKTEGYASIHCERPFAKFRENTNIYTIEEGVKIYGAVPEKFRHYRVSLRNTADERLPLSFKVKESGTVYLVSGKYPSRRLIREGWTAVGNIQIHDVRAGQSIVPALILEKTLTQGEYTFPLCNDWVGIQVLRD